MKIRIAKAWLAAAVVASSFASAGMAAEVHRFEVGEQAFLLDGKPLQVRCGEIHLARVPREYWRDRLRRCRAMGLNTVCAYLFWNFHEPTEGKFNWEGQADAAEFCRIAQQEGLWVILRPGPYACAEWEMGGLPWWLLKDKDIKLRTTDPRFMGPAKRWLTEVGRVMGPLQVDRGGPILMVQVENEYGFYGKDVEYMRELEGAVKGAGFTVPLFACNPPYALKNGTPSDLFKVVNFGKDPAGGFKALREVQPTGPLMCGEFYPGWFDTWGAPHHRGEEGPYLKDLEYMLSKGASFSLYMAHGGTTFGLWSGADRPFKPDTSSYDYDAPISEAGWTSGEKFRKTRELMSKYLGPGETLPAVPADNPVMAVPAFELKERAGVFENLPEAVEGGSPRNFEAYDQGFGCVLYRAKLPAGAAGTLEVGGVRDFGWVFVDGKQVGVLDRRARRSKVTVPAREKGTQLDILVEAMGRVNFGPEVHDRKGLYGPVKVAGQEVAGGWEAYRLPLDGGMLAGLKWKQGGDEKGPAFWRGTFTAKKVSDTFLDVSTWGKGVVWVNGHCLGRYWDIGPTQTMYLPGPWIKAGENEVVVLDLVGPERAVMAGVEKPVLDRLRPEKDFGRQSAKYGKLAIGDVKPVKEGEFAPGGGVQTVMFGRPVEGRQFCFEARSSQDGKRYAAVAELDLLDADGNVIPHTTWSVAYVDSEETAGEDGSASNAIDGQTANFWHTQWKDRSPGFPHRLVIDLGATVRVAGFRYVPRAGEGLPGRVKEYAVYVGDALVRQ